MHINAFVPTDGVEMVDGCVDAKGVPLTFFTLPSLQPHQSAHQLTAPILLGVWSENGADTDPHFYVQARDPHGRLCGNMEQMWFWKDEPNLPYKWRVFDISLTFLIPEPGLYTFGVFANRDDPTEDALASFPFMINFDPALPPMPTPPLPPGAEYKA